MDPTTLTPAAHQQIVLMVGSKKEWQNYLGLEDKAARSIWINMGLKAPSEYVRSLPAETIARRVLALGHKKAAEWYGMSESGLKSILKERDLTEHYEKNQFADKTTLEFFLVKYGSVRFLARMMNTTESWIREEARRLDVDAKLLIDWSLGNNANAKGRRAEQDWAKLRPTRIIEDLNVTVGSQAEYDFHDADLGKINVKCSRRHKYKAQTRSSDPYFWKLSLNAAEKCDHIVAICYDERMEEIIGIHVLTAEQACIHGTKTLTLQQVHLELKERWITD